MQKKTNLDHLKRSIPLKALAESYGVKLRRHGSSDWIGRCPLAGHVDRSASFVVSPKKNLWHCLGRCQRGGSVIDLVMAMEGLSFVKAVKRLEARVPATPATSPADDEPSVERDAEDLRLLGLVVEHHHRRLLECPRALEYLEKRGIASAEAIERFRLGFSDDSLGEILPPRSSAAGRDARERLARLGVMRSGPQGHEAFWGCVTIPVLGESGEVLELYGRSVHAAPAPARRHRYLRGPHRGVFNLDAFKTSEELIWTESLIDALTFWVNGFVHVTCSYGVEGFIEAHLAALKAHGTKRILIAYDRDAAGDAAALKLGARLAALGIGSWRVEFMKGSDANAYARLLQPANKSLALVLAKARWMGEGPEPERPSRGYVSVPPPAQEISAESITPRAADVAAPASPSASGSTPANGSMTPGAVPSIERELDPAPATEGRASISPSSTPSIERELGPAPATEDRVTISPSPDSPPATARSEAPAKSIASSDRASPLAEKPQRPAIAAPALAAEVREDEIVVKIGDRRYRARGFVKNTSVDVLKVNLLAAKGEAFYVDSLDLYAARARSAFTTATAKELRVDEALIKGDLGRLLLKLEELQDERIRGLAKPKDEAVKLTPAEEAQALELLKDPKLAERILSDFERCGMVGEEINKLTAYVAAVSRKLDDPLAIIIQSSSAAGKTSLMEAVLAFIPEEERIKYSAMTGQSLFYMGDTSLKHKILAIVEEEGAERAAYALKLLQSEKELSIASTGKDPTTGKLVTQEYRVEGPVMIFLTTTAISIDEELLNRCILLTVDEDRAQTRAIHRLQRRRETLEGALEHHDRQKILKLHQNAQRLLRPIRVANPFAERLTFGDHQTRMRRDHMKYLVLIRSIALLHQYQRALQKIEHDNEVLDFIEVELSDIALANRIASQVLVRSLDELAPQTRRFLGAVDQMVRSMEEEQSASRAEVRFTRRDLMTRLGFTYEQIRVHLDRLVELEHVLVHWGRRGQSYAYELLYDGRGFSGARLIELSDVSQVGERLSGTHPEFGVGADEFGVGVDEFGVPLGSHWGAIGAALGGAESGVNGRAHAELSPLGPTLSRRETSRAGANGHAREPK